MVPDSRPMVPASLYGSVFPEFESFKAEIQVPLIKSPPARYVEQTVLAVIILSSLNSASHQIASTATPHPARILSSPPVSVLGAGSRMTPKTGLLGRD